MSTELFAGTVLEAATLDRSQLRRVNEDADATEEQACARKPALEVCSALQIDRDRPSSWSQSGAKRLFDLFCVLLSLPLVVPVSLLIALSVRLTSTGPVLFLQKRMGRYGRTFTIVKFRTLVHSPAIVHSAVTTAENQRCTPVGAFLRRWKLDELPQLLNVLIGEMSLVGSRPKLPEHHVADLQCRPGITGAATIAFALEEAVLAHFPEQHLEDYYREVILPVKHRLDVKYMARATFISDFKLLVDTVLHRWKSSDLDRLLNIEAFDAGGSRISRPSVMAGNESIADD